MRDVMDVGEHAQDAVALAGRADREEFQEFLDETFPIGAVCAVIGLGGGHLDAATQIATGRLLCSGVEEDEARRRWYELVIDSRGFTGGEADRLKLWVSPPTRHESNKHLWEADVRTDESDHCTLRLNADPPEPWRPTVRMREAVTKAYAKCWPTKSRPQ